MAVASFYLKARQAKGTYGHSGTAEEANIFKYTKFTTKRKIFTAASLVVSFLASSVAYTVMVTPLTKPIPAVRPTIEKVADSENAWVEYDLAIHDLIDMPVLSRMTSKNLAAIETNILRKVQSPIYGGSEKVASGEAKLTEEQVVFLEKHQKAIDHLLAASKLPKAQFHGETPNLSNPVPNLLQMRALANLAGAKVQHLKEQGKIKEAVELALANYKMAVDIGAETNTTLITSLISVVCRGLTAKSLIALINSGVTTAEMDKEIARYVTEQDLRIPNAYQLISWEQQAFQISLEERLIKGNFESLDDVYKGQDIAKFIFKSLPGLRVRAYNKYVNLHQNNINSISSNLENWDFVTATNTINKLSQEPWNALWTAENITEKILFPYVSLPNGLSTMKSLYNCNAITKTVATFAACSAYKKNHNQFPATLDLAMNEVGLLTPIDLATKKPIGYRLENGNPRIWFAGVDGKNDGGLQAYDRRNFHSAIVGKDLVFSYGQLFFRD